MSASNPPAAGGGQNNQQSNERRKGEAHKLFARLRWTDLVSGENEEYIGPLPITLGRAPENTIVLNSQLVSRNHATLGAQGSQVMLRDLQTKNGTFVDDERITQITLPSGGAFHIGPFDFTMMVVAAPPLGTPVRTTADDPAETRVTTASLLGARLAADETVLAPVAELARSGSPRPPVVPLSEVLRTHRAVTEATYLSVGGGIGSFAWVDHLRIQGVPADQIVVVGLEAKPVGHYRQLTRNSQIPLHERLRSHSESCPDNIWGFPSYGMRETLHLLSQGKVGAALRVFLQVMGEPVFSDTYSPRAGDVFQAVEREAHRIGWERMWRQGRAQTLRRTDDGRYVVAYTTNNERGTPVPQYVVANYVHLAMGYPSIRLLDDLQDYRQRTGDLEHAVNAYEPHDHVYEHLLANGGVVMVRGRGIVASRVLQRLDEVRRQNQNIVIIHLHRFPVARGHLDGHARRPVSHHMELQPFNWPKACWTGSMRFRLENATEIEREQLLNDWGGTTTADRRAWQIMLDRGLQEGWYQVYFGEVQGMERNPQGQLVTHIATGKPHHPELWLVSDFMIDCTGLAKSMDDNPLLKDMVSSYHLRRNAKGGLDVANDFEVLGMGNGSGRVYASGVTTLGGPHAVVDSFLGLQYAALRSVEALTSQHAPGLHQLTPRRSTSEWVRWMRGANPK